MKKIISILILLVIFISPISAVSYAEDNEVYFSCENLAAAISELLDKETVTRQDMAELTGKIDLSNKNIKSLEGLEYAVNITELILSFNNIQDISPITSLSNLRSLYIDYNWITKLPEGQSQLTSLEHLDVSNNQIEDLPAKFLMLPSLRRLYIGNLSLKSAPDLDNVSDTLNRLDITGARLDDYSFIKSLTNLEFLVLNDCGLDELPDLSGMSEIGYLYFTDNNISSLPDYIGTLPLVRLDFSGNLISDIPQSFSNLKSLEQLVMTDNYFLRLPDVVTQLDSLEVLMCAQNLIYDVADNMGGLENVKRASFALNQLTTLEKFVDFDIPYSYQISFDLNYLDLTDELNQEVLEDYHNDGGKQRTQRAQAKIMSADTSDFTVEVSLSQSEIQAAGQNAEPQSILLFQVEGERLVFIAANDLHNQEGVFSVSAKNLPEGEYDFVVCLELYDDSWPPKTVKYPVYMSGIEIVRTATAEPVQDQANPTPTLSQETETEADAQEKSMPKYLLYILLLGVIIIISAIIIHFVINRRK